MMPPIQKRLIQAVQKLWTNQSDKILKKEKGEHAANLLAVYFWQVLQEQSEAQLDHAWWKLVDAKLVPCDDDLRTVEKGRHVLQRSDSLELRVELTAPRAVFSRKEFIHKIAKLYKLDIAELQAIADQCIHDSRTPLSKWVEEYAKTE